MKQIKIKQSQKGYTLIEVLLVVVLIGILLTIGLVSLNTEARFIENRNDTRKSHIRILEGAITQYKLQTGSYPTGLDRTYREICDPDVSSCSGFVDLKQFLVPNYLQAIPQDPKDTDNTGGAGYEVAIDTTTNTVSVRLKELLREGGVIIAVNDPLPAESTTTANSSLAATVPVTPPHQIPMNATYSQSSVYRSNQPADQVSMTNNMFTETSKTGTNSSSNEFITLDLGSNRNINRVVVGSDFNGTLSGGWGKWYTENKLIQVSTDNTNWTNVGNTGTFNSGIQSYSFGTISARYVRLYNGGSGYIAVTEFYAGYQQ